MAKRDYYETLSVSKDASEAGKQLEVMWPDLRYEEVHARKHQGNCNDDFYMIEVVCL